MSVATASFARWLDDRKDLHPDLSVNGRRDEGDGREIAILQAQQDVVEAVRLTLYEETPEGRWATTLTATQDAGQSWI